MNIVSTIKTIAKAAKKSELQNLDEIAVQLIEVGEYLTLNSIETLFFCAIFDRHCARLPTKIENLADYFSCTILEIIEHKDALESLENRNFICNTNLACPIFLKGTYSLTRKMLNCLVDNQEFNDEVIKAEEISHQEFTKTVGKWVANRDKEGLYTITLFDAVEKFEDKHNYLDFVKIVCQQFEDIADRTIFYDICFDKLTYVKDEVYSDVEATVRDVLEYENDRLRYFTKLRNGTSELLRSGWVRLIESEVNSKLTLTEDGLKLLYGENYLSAKVKPQELDRYSFVKKIQQAITRNDDNDFCEDELETSVLKLERAYGDLDFVQKCVAKIDKVLYRAIFYSTCFARISSRECVDELIDKIFNSMNEQNSEKKLLLHKQHRLQKLGLIIIDPAETIGEAIVSLSSEAAEMFLEDDFELYECTESTQSFILPESINAKKLFYDPNFEPEVSFLTDSLSEQKFNELQKRLSDNGMRKGVSAIFYGSSGTGKTETVYQIARKTGRAILHVDIANLKTCWYGESQKLVKGLFEKYRSMCKKQKQTPILLFNEADAIFSTRSSANGRSSVDQTENAIQNIILEEMESIEGIVIATTNIAGNLDNAFERRFLFKLKFDKPSPEIKSLIWKDKINYISDDEALELAKLYDFSGGQIENIVRKAVISEVLTGKQPDLDSLKRYCALENLETSDGKRIGF